VHDCKIKWISRAHQSEKRTPLTGLSFFHMHFTSSVLVHRVIPVQSQSTTVAKKLPIVMVRLLATATYLGFEHRELTIVSQHCEAHMLIFHVRCRPRTGNSNTSFFTRNYVARAECSRIRPITYLSRYIVSVKERLDICTKIQLLLGGPKAIVRTIALTNYVMQDLTAFQSLVVFTSLKWSTNDTDNVKRIRTGCVVLCLLPQVRPGTVMSFRV